MTRTVLILLATCVALASAAMASILARDMIPAAPAGMRPSLSTDLIGPSPNTDGKRDRLPVTGADSATPDAPLREALAPDAALPDVPPLAGPVPMPRPRNARPAVQKNYTLVSDMQIAAVKGRLRLSPAQEALWPDVEAALRIVARSMHERRQASPTSTPSLDFTSAEIDQLKNAATPLLATLRGDQKQELRALARLIGLDAVVSLI